MFNFEDNPLKKKQSYSHLKQETSKICTFDLEGQGHL
jgi:hypothetical protein